MQRIKKLKGELLNNKGYSDVAQENKIDLEAGKEGLIEYYKELLSGPDKILQIISAFASDTNNPERQKEYDKEFRDRTSCVTDISEHPAIFPTTLANMLEMSKEDQATVGRNLLAEEIEFIIQNIGVENSLLAVGEGKLPGVTSKLIKSIGSKIENEGGYVGDVTPFFVTQEIFFPPDDPLHRMYKTCAAVNKSLHIETDRTWVSEEVASTLTASAVVEFPSAVSVKSASHGAPAPGGM